MKFTIQQLDRTSKDRPQGYKEEILKLAKKIDDYYYELSDEDFSVLAKKYREPNFLEKIKNLHDAIGQLSEGFSFRDKNEIDNNLKICIECPFFKTQPFKCGWCGCYLKIKMQLKEWHCPLKKW